MNLLRSGCIWLILSSFAIKATHRCSGHLSKSQTFHQCLVFTLPNCCPIIVAHSFQISASILLTSLASGSFFSENFNILHRTGLESVDTISNLSQVLLLFFSALLSFQIGKGVHTSSSVFTLLFHQPIVLVLNFLHTSLTPAWNPVIGDWVEHKARAFGSRGKSTLLSKLFPFGLWLLNRARFFTR